MENWILTTLQSNALVIEHWKNTAETLAKQLQEATAKLEALTKTINDADVVDTDESKAV